MTVDRSRLPALGPPALFRPPQLRHTTLTNGVNVWTAAHHRAPVLTLKLLLPVGAADDPENQHGLAALTADILDEGTCQLTDVDLHKALTRIGAHLGLAVSSDATTLTLTTLAKHAKEAIALLLDVVTHPRLSSDDIDRVRDLRCNRILQMRQVPSAVADRVFIKSVYGSHPYGHLSIGTHTSLSEIDASSVTEFHGRCYQAAGWTLVAVGDLSHDTLLETVQSEVDRVIQGVPSPPFVSESRRQEPPTLRKSLVFVPRPDAVQSEVRLGHPGVSRNSEDYHALLVLNMVLGGQFGSRINLNLREDKGYTYGAHTSFDFRVGRGPFSFRSSVQTSVTAAAIREAIQEIQEIQTTRPPTANELRVARDALTRGFPLGLETASQVARVGTTLALHGLPVDEMDNFVQRVMAVDLDRVVAAAKTHLHPDKLVTVVVGSPDEVLPSLESLGLGTPALVE
jgi:zinc protease